MFYCYIIISLSATALLSAVECCCACSCSICTTLCSASRRCARSLVTVVSNACNLFASSCSCSGVAMMFETKFHLGLQCPGLKLSGVPIPCLHLNGVPIP